ncbi:MAG: hypothetical protein EPN84_13270 [Legionella sp.]|nr:MAG: hypothetical protein EPN84_13270 [Legionella sp.]
MRADIFFFLGIFAFIFVAWVSTGGPQRPISFSGPFITPVTNVNQEQRGYGNLWDMGSSETNWWTGNFGGNGGTRTQTELWRAQDDLEDLQRDLQESRLFGTPSVHRGIVSIAKSVGPLKSVDADEEYVTISVSSGADAPVSITGWKLISVRTNSSASIPQGVALFRTGKVNSPQPITLSPGERAIVTTGRSPIGVSFKENSCSGYLEERQNFHPSLSSSCPSPRDDFARFYDGAANDYQKCKEAITTVPRCTTATDLPRNTSNKCQSFAREFLTYNGCITYHASDRNFQGRVWRVYLGNRNDDLWPTKNDTIKLLDAEGKTVDIFTY